MCCRFPKRWHYELKGTGVTVTALCPGVTQSGFFDQARMHHSGLVRNFKLPTSDEVAEAGYRAMQRGQVVYVAGVLNRMVVAGVRFHASLAGDEDFGDGLGTEMRRRCPRTAGRLFSLACRVKARRQQHQRDHRLVVRLRHSFILRGTFGQGSTPEEQPPEPAQE